MVGLLLNVVKSAVTVIFCVPSNGTVLMVLAVDNLVAVDAALVSIVIEEEPSKVTLLIVTGFANLVAVIAASAVACNPNN